MRNLLDKTLPFSSASGPPGLETEYADAFGAWKQAQNPETNRNLLKAVDPVINTAVKSYGGPSQGSPMLRSQARRMALQAFQTYDPSRGGLKTHLLSQLQRLQRVGAQQAQIISVPEQVAADRRHLEETARELEIRQGRPPSDQALANTTGLSLKRIQYVRQGRPAIAEGQVLAGQPADQQQLPASQIPGQSRMEAGWNELVYHDLDEVNQTVYDYLTGAHGHEQLSTSDIARRLGITPSAVSQRAAAIQNLLDERWQVGGI
jgi:DNA-directed RNA polymerase specialized sigma subunit